MADNYDGSIKIDTEIDTQNAEKGIKNLKDLLGKFGGATAGVTAAAKTFKLLTKNIKETSDAYNVQLKAEKSLETAAKNNPYLDNTSVKQLESFASELQSISTVGDETLIPLMAQLASAGRSQAEIQEIMSAALDVSASGMMSLDSAVTQLNATYSGNIGLLGRQVSELKDLTTEELKSGKAVGVLADKFRGMAEETAKTTGSFQQMKNAQGDFNEAVGKITKPTADVWNNFWKGWYEKGVETLTKLNNKINEQTIGKALSNKITTEMNKITDEELRFDFAEDSLDFVSDEDIQALKGYIDNKKNQTAAEKQLGKVIEYVNKHRAYAAEIEKTEREEAAKKQKADEDAANAQKEYNNAISNYNDSLQEALDKLQLEAELKNEEVTEQDKLNAMLDAYYTLISDIGTEDPFSQQKLQELKDFAKNIEWVTESEEELEQAALDAGKALLEQNNNKTVADTIQDTIDALKLEAEQYKDNADAYQDYVNTIDQLSDLRQDAIKKERQDSITDAINDASDYINQFADITQNLADLALDKATANSEKETEELTKSYTDGLISYKEYCEKKKEISKKQKNEEYKAQMWEWRASLLQATANIAQGVSKAIADGGVAGIVTGALVSAAGAVQLAQLQQAMPQKPTFATGGIVGGNSYTGDHVNARVNSGEMVLNAVQQANLWKMANNGNGSGAVVNMPVNIESRNGSAVDAQLTDNGLQIIIDDAVNVGLRTGRYSKSLKINNTRNTGVRYL